jgi:AcrR family transcriptional regulator
LLTGAAFLILVNRKNTMGRPAGTKNPGHEKRRALLAQTALPRLLADDGGRASLNELAAAADVSVPTLKHYFGDRSGVVAAALDLTATFGVEHTARLAVPSSRSLARSLTDAAAMIRTGWQSGVDRIFTLGLVHGSYDALAGPAFVRGVLEPVQDAMERRLRMHHLRGEAHVEPASERVAALQFVSPLFLALLHQGPLAGQACRPLPMDAFVAAHVAAFARAWAAR